MKFPISNFQFSIPGSGIPASHRIARAGAALVLAVLMPLLAPVVIPAARAADAPLTVAAQTWTLRNMNFDQVVEFCVKNNIKYIQAIASHIDPNGPREETLRKKAVLDRHGLVCYTFGVAGTSMDKEQNRKLFEFAKLLGIRLIIVEPGDFKILDNLEELVKEYDIKIAIHNHGIKSLYGNPAVVKNLIQHRDPRVGVCMDTGWVTSGRFDAAKVYRDYAGRVFDIHLKDKKVTHTEGGDVAIDTFIGKGDANLQGLFKELVKSGYTGKLAIETDHPDFAREPQEFVAGALDYVRDFKP